MSAPQNIGPKRLVVGAHYGVKDWILQRITAVILVVYTLVLGIGALVTPEFTYENWVRLFNFEVLSFPLGKLLAMLAFLSLAYHAWIGVRDIWMDYVKPTGIRLALQVLTVLWLVGSVVYAAQILWRI
ncbi:succinate dehydrogenase, hydrophobic membrane anchor protein [Pigmentiphaga sp. GD03639]|jgi:succinate dehydrogenase / fumarate reductase membrane anchor subunit|uniref:Succinate dehydrogenase hydrophobic membrane anchor subunit n=1 Tax=Pigmentiphaga daeguensis TaxID=414049 RepID=A0ABP3MKF4_9BURK|nr:MULTISPECIES: succinate dehydrogenase, hydrophobic membrane anchor protein [unclassified Pigmentiphaga]MDH2235724.1 succinate dehydrogenase, hydrophobic membrane anchor protein [Pigmentiphaga sp. GD03639]OVZ59219.1 succinate dehydrogenase, hydrophobic membrane anchor protein [Pigmentiphaga sp. NML030171]